MTVTFIDHEGIERTLTLDRLRQIIAKEESDLSRAVDPIEREACIRTVLYFERVLLEVELLAQPPAARFVNFKGRSRNVDEA